MIYMIPHCELKRDRLARAKNANVQKLRSSGRETTSAMIKRKSVTVRCPPPHTHTNPPPPTPGPDFTHTATMSRGRRGSTLPKRQSSARNGFGAPIAFTWSIKDVNSETKGEGEDDEEKNAEQESPGKRRGRGRGRGKGRSKAKGKGGAGRAAKGVNAKGAGNRATGSSEEKEVAEEEQKEVTNKGGDAKPSSATKPKAHKQQQQQQQQRKKRLSKSATVGSLRGAKAASAALSKTVASSGSAKRKGKKGLRPKTATAAHRRNREDVADGENYEVDRSVPEFHRIRARPQSAPLRRDIDHKGQDEKVLAGRWDTSTGRPLDFKGRTTFTREVLTSADRSIIVARLFSHRKKERWIRQEAEEAREREVVGERGDGEEGEEREHTQEQQQQEQQQQEQQQQQQQRRRRLRPQSAAAAYRRPKIKSFTKPVTNADGFRSNLEKRHGTRHYAVQRYYRDLSEIPRASLKEGPEMHAVALKWTRAQGDASSLWIDKGSRNESVLASAIERRRGRKSRCV